MTTKRPTLVIYWTDSRALLSYQERKDLEFYGQVVSVTPLEILVENPMTGRKAAIVGTSDKSAPLVPSGLA